MKVEWTTEIGVDPINDLVWAFITLVSTILFLGGMYYTIRLLEYICKKIRGY